ncbi:hypothetical protein QYE76_040945 [Lolium multiflorum]|uniref:DUF4219 domain-containing protein n=1 Tax=Lolium multiflorum TaxID=4521 RepID=A0AAD8TDW9_LOLMU|nr:hypothetical protein QYE76_040945 [Lolium multiflorum]
MALVPHGGGAGGSAMPLFCPMLTRDNYTVWAIKVEANLDVQGVWEAVVPADPAAVVDTSPTNPSKKIFSELDEINAGFLFCPEASEHPRAVERGHVGPTHGGGTAQALAAPP